MGLEVGRAIAWNIVPNPFVGRDRELSELARALDDAAAGQGRLFLLAGEPGIGKTRLADEVTKLATERCFDVVWGRCWESGGAPAYWPWAQALGTLVREKSRSELEQCLGSAAPDVARIVPSLRDKLPNLAERSTSGIEERFQLYAAVHGFLRALAAKTPVAIVLDDLHAADVSSLGLLQFVARELRGTRLFVLGTYRDVEARLTEEVSRLLAQAARDGKVLSLARLDRDQTAEFVSGSGGASELAAAVFEASQGNPLFAEELLRLVSARDKKALPELPESVREVIRGRLDLLSEEAKRIISLASVLGPEFELDTAAALAGGSVESIEPLLAEIARAGVAHERDRGRWAFSHILYREVLYRELGRARRAELHGLAADRIRSRYTPRAKLSELLHHCLEAGDTAGAVAAAVGAADWAFERQAYEDAVTLLEGAAAQSAVPELDRHLQFDLLLALGRSRIGAGRAAAGIESCVAAAAIARSLGDPELLARAALGYGLVIMPGVVDPVLVALLEEARAGLGAGHDGLRACVMARLAGAMQPSYDVQVPMQLAREAVALARTVNDTRTMATVLYGAGAALAAHASPEERIALGVEHEQLATELGERTQLLRARRRLVFAYLELANLEAADGTIAAYETVARQLGQPHELWPALLMRAMRAAMHGRFPEADALYAEASELAARAGAGDAPAALSMHRLCRLLLQERHAEILSFLPAMRPVLSGSPASEIQIAMNEAFAYARIGRVPERTWVLDAILSFELPRAESVWIAGHTEVVLALGETRHLDACYEMLSSKAGRLLSWGTYGMACEGPLTRMLALVACRLDRRAEALQHFEQAVRQADALGLVPSAARIRYDWAKTLIEGGSPADRVAARGLLDASLLAAQELEMPGLIEFIERLSAAPIAVPEQPPRRPFDSRPEFRREGDVWAIRFDDAVFRLKDSKGLQFLATLIEAPGREFHVLELVDPRPVGRDLGDAGELLDRRAIDEYRQRVEALDDTIAEAESFGDLERAARARAERDQIASEVARAVGLDGRQRRAGSGAERARTAVQRRIKDALQRIGEQCPALEQHLEIAVRTGAFCSYRPRDIR